MGKLITFPGKSCKEVLTPQEEAKSWAEMVAAVETLDHGLIKEIEKPQQSTR